MTKHNPDLSPLFHALADPTRRSILTSLVQQGPTRVTDLAAYYRMSLNSVSKHIKVLEAAGLSVVCTSRDPERARRRHPGWELRELDVDRPETIPRALEGVARAVYLIHGMGAGDDYPEREQRAAEAFRESAERARLRRVVYLGGIEPAATPSRHLASRLQTGRTLRAGSVSTIELGASMIIGEGSESWRIVRDLATRLPVMVLPRWLDSRTEPIDLRDVTAAIAHALALEHEGSAAYPLPGPELMSLREVLRRTAALAGIRPVMLPVPFVTPRLSSYWLRLVTRANRHIADELVEGLTSDLYTEGEGFWRFMPEHERVPFDEAARRALAAEARGLSPLSRSAEGVLQALSRRAQK